MQTPDRKILQPLLADCSKKDAILLKEAAAFSARMRAKHGPRHGRLHFEQTAGIAGILRELHLGSRAVAAGLLHDLCDIPSIEKNIRSEFGDEIAHLVEGYKKVDDLTHVTQTNGNEDEYIQMVFSVAEDMRIVILFAANRYYKVMHLDELPRLDTKLIAERTMVFYAPLLHRLGLGKYKAEMENSAFKVLHPQIYEELSSKLAEWRYQRDRFLNKIVMQLEYLFKKYDLSPRLEGRTKHLHSIYRKMQRTGREFEQIFDVLAVRAIVSGIPDCYKTLAVVQQHFTPILQEFDDYIQRPKPNGYQSLHVLLEDKTNFQFELQIRTDEMHKTAEYGIAAHWQYKEGKKGNDFDQYFKWLREHVSFKGEVKSEVPVSRFFNLKSTHNDIFVLTPAGDLKRLPRGSTPIDFAFAVHRDVGLKCGGARVNGTMVPFETELHNGDRVEIKTASRPTINSDWMKYAKSQKARNHIRKWLREKMQQHSMKLGEEILTRGLRKQKISCTNKNFKVISEKFSLSSIEELFIVVGSGKLSVQAIIQKSSGEDGRKSPEETPAVQDKGKQESPDGITVGGMESLMVKFAKCCMPVPGDPIFGYITRGKGITVHRAICKNAVQLKKEPERRIDVKWGQTSEKYYIAGIRTMLFKPENFIKEVTPIFGLKKVHLVNYQLFQLGGRDFCTLVINVRNTDELKVFLNAVRKMKNVKHVERLKFPEYKHLIKAKPIALGT
ncbi:RelA/SpoT family protein [candidate division KSB1 bacterium]